MVNCKIGSGGFNGALCAPIVDDLISAWFISSVFLSVCCLCQISRWLNWGSVLIAVDQYLRFIKPVQSGFVHGIM